jgi:hypothetical protein
VLESMLAAGRKGGRLTRSSQSLACNVRQRSQANPTHENQQPVSKLITRKKESMMMSRKRVGNVLHGSL